MLHELTFINIRNAERTTEGLSTQQFEIRNRRTRRFLGLMSLLGVTNDLVPTLAELVVDASKELVESSREACEVFEAGRGPQLDELLQLPHMLDNN